MILHAQKGSHVFLNLSKSILIALKFHFYHILPTVYPRIAVIMLLILNTVVVLLLLHCIMGVILQPVSTTLHVSGLKYLAVVVSAHSGTVVHGLPGHQVPVERGKK